MGGTKARGKVAPPRPRERDHGGLGCWEGCGAVSEVLRGSQSAGRVSRNSPWVPGRGSALRRVGAPALS